MARLTCTNCSAELTLGARFCAQCGEPVKQGEGFDANQRILSLVFIDLVESTALAAKADLEGYDATLQKFHETASGLLQAYGGMVLQHYGDGILACFGLRQDGEDAALAAIAASLAVRDAIPDQLNGAMVRIGVHRGTVFCRVGTGGKLTPQITGLDVNIAARVQEQATAGSVVISDASLTFTQRIARIEARKLPRTILKGVPEPIDLYEVASYAVTGLASRNTPLFERDEVIARLSEPGAPVALVGPAGMGKTALITELSRHADPECERVNIFARFNLRFSPLFPITDWLARRLGYASFPIAADQIEGDPRADLTERIRLLLPDFADEQLDSLADVLNLPGGAGALYAAYTGPQLRAARIAVLTDILHALTTSRAALVVFDDFHWADLDSVAVIDGLITRGLDPDSSLILTARPTVEVSEFTTEKALEVVELTPLSETAAREAIEADLSALDPAEVDRIVRYAEGNPLFLWTLLDAARRTGEGGSDTIEATFQGIINSFDALRNVIQLGSVIGRKFTLRQLEYLADDRPYLRDELAFLELNGVFQRDPVGLSFGHILMRDAAYNMIPASQRREMHGRFADALAADDKTLCADFPEVLAEHYLEAGDPAKIVGSSTTAGISFLKRANFDLSVKYLTHALEAIGTDAPQEEAAQRAFIDVLTLLASAQVQRFGFSHPTVADSYHKLEEAVSDAHALGMERMRALYGLFAHRMISGGVRACRAQADRMSQLAEPDDKRQQILRWVNVSAHGLYSGRFDQTMHANEQVKALYRKADHSDLFLEIGADPLVSILSSEIHVHAYRQDLTAARAAMTAALDHIEAIGAELQRPWILIFGSVALFFGGARDEALKHTEAGIALADQQGAAFWQLIGRAWQAVFLSEIGKGTEGQQLLDAILPQLQAIGVELNLPVFWTAMAGNLLRDGKIPEAKEISERAVRLLAVRGEGKWGAFAWQRRARIALADGDQEGAERAWAIAAAYAKRGGATIWLTELDDAPADLVVQG